MTAKAPRMVSLQQVVPRRYPRFVVRLPVTVVTNPVPPHWIPLQFLGETLEMGRGGTSVRFSFDVSRFLAPGQLVRLLVGHKEHVGPHHAINARVVWANRERIGFEFLRVLRTDETPEASESDSEMLPGTLMEPEPQ